MTRRMADSVNVPGLPTGMDLYAGYIDGRYDNVAAIRARFPGKTVMAITVNPADNEGDCLDVENGDATPQQSPAWIVKRRQAGHGGPLVYCSWSNLTTVEAAFAAAQVPTPGFWVAGYPAPDGDAIPPGTVGHQWIDHGGWDESIMVDYLPGIDPAPTPPAPPPPVHLKEKPVLIIEDGQTQYLLFESGRKVEIPDPADLTALATQVPSVPELTPTFVASIPNV